MSDEASMSENQAASLEVAPGTRVQVDLIDRKGKREHLAFDLVPDEQADFESGFLGAGTPLGKAVLGHKAGSTVPYRVGDLVRVQVLSVEQSVRGPAADAAEKREALLRQARSKSDLNNMISFALTFDSKWGDYDPEEIANQWEDNSEKSDKPEDKPKE